MSTRRAGSGSASALTVFDRTVRESVRQARLQAQRDATFVPPVNDVSSVLALRSLLRRPVQPPTPAPPAPIHDVLHAADYGVIGDGITDDWAAMQAALDDGAAKGKVVSGGNLIVATSGPLTGSGPGLIFDTCAFGGVSDPVGIKVTGSGYTALTWSSSRLTQMRLCIWGTGNTANGLYFDHVTFCQAQKIRVFDLDGFGVKLDELWDSTILDISVELCGNASNYAFSLTATSDTSNMSHIGRLQVEQANKQAIFMAGSTLSCVIDNIHSERATADAGYLTWDIGAARSVFNGGRFHALSPSTDATLVLRGEDTVFNAIAAEDEIKVLVDAESTSTMTLVSPNFAQATVSLVVSDHSGLVQFIGGSLGTLSTDVEVDRKIAMQFYGTHLVTADIGDCGNPTDPALLLFDSCTIGTLASHSTNSTATFRNCVIAEGGNLLEYSTRLIGSTVTCASTLAGRGAVIAESSIINANVLMNSGATLIGRALRVNGTLGQSTNCSSLLDAACYATGAVTGLGIPTSQPTPQANLNGVWRVGQRHHNLAAAAGGVPGWVCTTEGGTGTFVFKAEAILSV